MMLLSLGAINVVLKMDEKAENTAESKPSQRDPV